MASDQARALMQPRYAREHHQECDVLARADACDHGQVVALFDERLDAQTQVFEQLAHACSSDLDERALALVLADGSL